MIDHTHDAAHLDHLRSIELRLSHERSRRDAAKPGRDRDWRDHNVRMIEKERADHIAFLAERGIVVNDASPADADMTDDELLAALNE